MTEYRCKRCGKTWFENDGRDGMEFSFCEVCFELGNDPVPTGSPQHYQYSEKGYAAISGEVD